MLWILVEIHLRFTICAPLTTGFPRLCCLHWSIKDLGSKPLASSRTDFRLYTPIPACQGDVLRSDSTDWQQDVVKVQQKLHGYCFLCEPGSFNVNNGFSSPSPPTPPAHSSLRELPEGKRSSYLHPCNLIHPII
ncbi:hypothetical protein FQA47_012123 [Oryzias melastigma]|uniref:Uncharacterized protein n=1 Tax=Oryzias melastigma TaxID=30732 RepID=A0A834C4J0_ORYME|nr:hypothetical protein FQA47_012123 [Oryzias melastigma]